MNPNWPDSAAFWRARHVVVTGRRGVPGRIQPREVDSVVSGKRFNVEWVKGPVGVQSRNFRNERIYSTGWRARILTLEGIRRMAQAMTEHGLPRPHLEEVGSEFRVTLIGPGERFMQEIKMRPAWAEGLNERQVEAVMYVGEHGRITNREYRGLTGISRRWAAKELQEMVDREILVTRGTGRAIHYLLLRG